MDEIGTRNGEKNSFALNIFSLEFRSILNLLNIGVDF